MCQRRPRARVWLAALTMAALLVATSCSSGGEFSGNPDSMTSVPRVQGTWELADLQADDAWRISGCSTPNGSPVLVGTEDTVYAFAGVIPRDGASDSGSRLGAWKLDGDIWVPTGGTVISAECIIVDAAVITDDEITVIGRVDRVTTTWLSPDGGQTWQVRSSPGPDSFVRGLAATSTGPIAYGHTTTTDSRPAIWVSDSPDGEWKEVLGRVGETDPSPDGGRYSTPTRVIGIVDLNGTLVAMINSGVSLTSTDGRSWRPNAATGVVGEAVTLATNGDSVVAASNDYAAYPENGTRVWISRDGVTWQAARQPPDASRDTWGVGRSGIAAFAGGFVAVGRLTLGQDAQFCFQDLESCRQALSVAWSSTDGDTWIPSLLGEPGGRPSQSPGRVVNVAGLPVVLSIPWDTNDPLPRQAWRLISPSDSTVAAAPPPASIPFPTTTVPPLPLLSSEAEELVVGERWRYEYWLCGDLIGEINGRLWRRTADLTFPFPDTWPTYEVEQPLPDAANRSILGTLELTAPDRLEFGIEGEGTVIVFEPTDDSSQGFC